MKDLINNIIQDLGDDKPIKGILLKAQIVASNLGNKEFETWINNEQNGYPDLLNIPDYRVLNASIKVDIFRPLLGVIKNFPIPIGTLQDDNINECLYHVRICYSLSEIEHLCDTTDGDCLSFICPAMIFPAINSCIQNGEAQSVRQEVALSSVQNIIDKFKSKLLTFFLELDKKIDTDIDFSKIESQKEITQIMNVQAVVANFGNGSVSTGNISGNINDLYVSSVDQKEEINDLVRQLQKEVDCSNNADLKVAMDTINAECQKPSWAKSTLNLAFNAIKGIASGIAANKLTPIVNKALDLLS